MTVAAALFALGCGARAPMRVSRADARNPLGCAGQTLESVVPIPELGLLPSGEPVTAGLALTCTADGLTVLDWGPDSSASYAVARQDAMRLWTTFQVPASHDARRLAVMRLLADPDR